MLAFVTALCVLVMRNASDVAFVSGGCASSVVFL
jgi:hypothetical protein